MIRKPGRYGDRMFLKEHKTCSACGESETRLATPFCCWCGARHTTVVIDADWRTIRVSTPIDGTTDAPRMLPGPSARDE